MCPKQCMFIQGNYFIEFKILWRAKLKCLTVKFFFFLSVKDLEADQEFYIIFI